MTFDIIRAWKDEDYRNGLSKEQLAQLPENPAGQVELSDEDLGKIAGGVMPTSVERSTSLIAGALMPTSVERLTSNIFYS